MVGNRGKGQKLTFRSPHFCQSGCFFRDIRELKQRRRERQRERQKSIG